jgi:nicotinamidase-related amidase
MTTLTGRPRTALIVIDVQNEIMGTAHERDGSEPLVRKTFPDSFEDTDLETTLVADAHTTVDLTEWGAPPPEQVISHTNMYWSGHRAPGRTAGTVVAADVDFSLLK